VTLEEICHAVWGRCGHRERNHVYVVLHRLRERGQLQTFERRFQLKKVA
jgi:hypothetical protein